MTDPARFYWGTATAAYQIEGAWLEGGKGLSIWDAFAHTPGKVEAGHTGDIACDHYHRWAEDIALMQQLGVNAYRFSIAWPRIFPQGRGAVNAEGVAFYNRLIDGLIAAGITPFVTLYHWDLPLSLQLEQDGWLNRQTAEDFAAYARFCFSAFGERVQHWITFNESWCTAVLGHGTGYFAPGRNSPDEPYIAGHNLLIAHGLAVEAFRKGGFSGQIGLASNCDWREPLTDTPEDKAAAQRSLEFFYGWFTDPVVFGDYPAVMRERLGARLPHFSPEDQARLKGSVDFLGLNHYTTHFASATPPSAHAIAPEDGNGGMAADQGVYLSADPSWHRTAMGWFVVPWGFRKMLNWVHKRYPNLPIYVTENGCANPLLEEENSQSDQFRVAFLQAYLAALLDAKQLDQGQCRVIFAGPCWTTLNGPMATANALGWCTAISKAASAALSRVFTSTNSIFATTMSQTEHSSPCMSCGACCAYFRVSFYWGEQASAGGQVPDELTQKISPHLSCMQGTGSKPARCVALGGEIGESVACTIYAQRSSTCREFAMSGENGEHNPECDKARAFHGLAPLVWQV